MFFWINSVLPFLSSYSGRTDKNNHSKYFGDLIVDHAGSFHSVSAQELKVDSARMQDLIVGSGRVITGYPNSETIDDEYACGCF